jgi:hypothetical protein
MLGVGRLTQCVRIIVASGTTRSDANVVHRCVGAPGRKVCSRVARFARLCRRHVFHIGRLAQCVCAVVAARATRRDAGVVHRRTRTECREVRLRMARLAGLGR